MKVTRTVADLRATLAGSRREGRTIGLVATMGALHEGHVSLIRRARSQCDAVVVSVFVNPAQFGLSEDLASYPRDPDGDAALAAAAGADVLFAPPVAEVYPSDFATTVTVDRLGERLCGAARGAEHFHGVATVVTKLLNMVGPDVAYFGQKDAQQAAVIRRLVADLNIPTRIEICPTVREADGLAMSSRNAYLTAEERSRATALHRGLCAARAAIVAGERDPVEILRQAEQVLTQARIEPEYLELVSPESLEPLDALEGDVLIAVAARVGRARLIDNIVVAAPGTVAPSLEPDARRQPCSA